VVAIWLQKHLEKTKLRRMSGIPPQYLDLKARYGTNIKYRDLRWNNVLSLETGINTGFLNCLVAKWLQ